ncbi:Cytidylate kinase [Candidatus Entotheonellaceae bacterium PAL068K]
MSRSSSSHVVVAIDGPSGAGKSTVAKQLASVLGYRYVDSGAMYRAVGWVVHSSAESWDDGAAIVALLERMKIEITFLHGRPEVWGNDRQITGDLRSEAVARAASAVAKQAVVRQVITSQLRRLRCQADLVMEGRDIGTVVFPDATVKFYLDAPLEVRAQRRFLEMQQVEQEMPFEHVACAVAARDAQDLNRVLAPLRSASDARVIDTTDFTIDELVQRMLLEIHSHSTG